MNKKFFLFVLIFKLHVIFPSSASVIPDLNTKEVGREGKIFRLEEINIVSLQGPWSKGEVLANFLALAGLVNHYYWLIQKGKTLPITTKFEKVDLIATPLLGGYFIFQMIRWYLYMQNVPRVTLADYIKNEKNVL